MFKDNEIAFSLFRVIELVGSGGKGEVYKAENTNLHKIVALKVLSHAVRESIDLVRFQNEAKALNRLTHPNIASLYDFAVGDNGTPYIVMEYVEGMTLERAVELNGPLTGLVFCEVFGEVCDALDYLHGKGAIHRDIKPSNIMLSPEGKKVKATLVDFGLAIVTGDPTGRLTSAGTILGSPLYMSPEQVEGKEVSIQSDLYSLSCVMFFALTGHPPFETDNLFELMSMHRLADPPMEKIASIGDISEVLSSTITRGLKKERSERPASVKEFLSVLLEPDSDDTVSDAIAANFNKTVLEESSVVAEQRSVSRNLVICLLVLVAVVPVVVGLRLRSSTLPVLSQSDLQGVPAKVVPGIEQQISEQFDDDDFKDRLNVATTRIDQSNQMMTKNNLTKAKKEDVFRSFHEGVTMLDSLGPRVNTDQTCIKYLLSGLLGEWTMAQELGRFDEAVLAARRIAQLKLSDQKAIQIIEQFELYHRKNISRQTGYKSVVDCLKPASQLAIKQWGEKSLMAGRVALELGTYELSVAHRRIAKNYLLKARDNFRTTGQNDLFTNLVIEIRLGHVYRLEALELNCSPRQLELFKCAVQHYRSAEQLAVTLFRKNGSIPPAKRTVMGHCYLGLAECELRLGRPKSANRLNSLASRYATDRRDAVINLQVLIDKALRKS